MAEKLQDFKPEIYDVQNKLVIFRSKETIEGHMMSTLSQKLKKSGAAEVVFADSDFMDLKVELFSDEDLKNFGLQRIMANGRPVLTEEEVPTEEKQPKKKKNLPRRGKKLVA